MSQPLRNELSNPGVFNSRLFNHDLFNFIKLNVWKFLGWNVQKCLATVCLYVHLLAIHIWMTPKSLLWWWWKVVMMSATSLMIWVCLWLSLMLLLLCTWNSSASSLHTKYYRISLKEPKRLSSQAGFLIEGTTQIFGHEGSFRFLLHPWS